MWYNFIIIVFSFLIIVPFAYSIVTEIIECIRSIKEDRKDKPNNLKEKIKRFSITSFYILIILFIFYIIFCYCFVMATPYPLFGYL